MRLLLWAFVPPLLLIAIWFFLAFAGSDEVSGAYYLAMYPLAIFCAIYTVWSGHIAVRGRKKDANGQDRLSNGIF